MTVSSLKDRIVEKIAELGEIEPHQVSEESSLKDLGIDSLMAIELVVFIEKTIQRTFPEERIAEIRTCADILRQVELLTGSAA